MYRCTHVEATYYWQCIPIVYIEKYRYKQQQACLQQSPMKTHSINLSAVIGESVITISKINHWIVLPNK